MASKFLNALGKLTLVFAVLFGIYHIYISRKLDQKDFNG